MYFYFYLELFLMIRFFHLALSQHRILVRGRIGGKLEIEGYRAGSYWV